MIFLYQNTSTICLTIAKINGKCFSIKFSGNPKKCGLVIKDSEFNVSYVWGNSPVTVRFN